MLPCNYSIAQKTSERLFASNVGISVSVENPRKQRFFDDFCLPQSVTRTKVPVYLNSLMQIHIYPWTKGTQINGHSNFASSLVFEKTNGVDVIFSKKNYASGFNGL